MWRHSLAVQTVGFLTVRWDGMLRWSCGVLRAQREASERGCARERIWAYPRIAGSGSSGRCNLGPKAGTVTSDERFSRFYGLGDDRSPRTPRLRCEREGSTPQKEQIFPCRRDIRWIHSVRL